MVNVTDRRRIMQPWQEAGDAIKESARYPFLQMKKASNLLSYIVPTGLAVQGLSKVNPKIKKFFNMAQMFGFTAEEAIDSIRKKVEKSEQPENKNLFQRLIGNVDITKLSDSDQKQLSFLEQIATQLEQKGKDESDPAIKNLKKKIMNILKGKAGLILEEATRDISMEQQQMQPQEIIQPPIMQQQMPEQISQQPGQGQQALMSILQKIKAMRGDGG